jgi:hypothetical protein
MPEFAIVSINEAKLRTKPGRQASYMTEYASYIQQLPTGQAGKLRMGAQENPLTIRRRLHTAAMLLGIHLIIKRSGTDVYFWRDSRAEESPKPKLRYTRRGKPHEETATPEQYFRESGELKQAVSEQSVSDAV